MVGDEVVDKPFAERTDEDKELMRRWYPAFNWYMTLERAGYPVRFVNPTKRAKREEAV